MKKRKKKKYSKIGLSLMLGGIMLVFGALLLVEYNIWQDFHARDMRDSIVEQIEDKRKTDDTDNDNQVAFPMEMPTIEINGYLYVGTLAVPSLELDLPVLDRWDDSRLKISPCRYKGSVYQDDMIIAAHNYRSHFGRLKDLKIGDEVSFTDVDGNEFHYVISEMQLLDKTAIEEMESGGWDLTLFTCTVGGASRVTIRCMRIKD